jgi:hypothetical protein
MLAYFGDIRNVNNSGGFGALPTAVSQTGGPVIISTISGDNSEKNYTPSNIADVANIVGTLKTKVWMRIDASISPARPSLLALDDVSKQMSAFVGVFVGMNLDYFLEGFVVDCGNVRSLDEIAEIVNYSHDILEKPVGVVNCDSVGLAMNGAGSFGQHPQFSDFVIHASPLTIDAGWGEAAISPNLGKLAQILQTMKTRAVRQYVLQEFPFLSPAVSDGAGGLQMTLPQIQIMRRAAYLFEVCGVTGYHFTVGAASINGFVNRRVYEPLAVLQRSDPATQPNPYGVAQIFIDSDSDYIYVKARVNSVTETLGLFSKTLNPVVKQTVTDNTIIDLYGLELNDASANPILVVGAFGENIMDSVLDPQQTAVLDNADLTIAIRDIYTRLAAMTN